MTETAPSPGRRMKRLSVFIASALAALSLVLVLSVTALLFRQPIVNSDPVRGEITELARRLTGRTLVIEGDILIDNFPWITIVIGPGALDNPEGFEGPPLFSWQRITLSAHYSTLYEPEPLLGSIIIEGLVAEPRIDRAGRNNFSDIGPLEDSGPSEAALRLPSIELRNAQVRYTDETVAEAALVNLDNLRLKVDDLRRGAGAIEGSRFKVGSIVLEGRFKSSEPLGLVADGLLKTTLEGIELNVPQNESIEIAIKETATNFGALKATLKDIEVAPDGVRASLLAGPAALDALMTSVGITPPFRSTPDLFQLRELSAKLSYADGVIGADSIMLRVDNTRVSGAIRVGDPIRLSIDVDAIDFERYAAAVEGGESYDPEAPLAFPGKLLQSLPLDGRIRFGNISARGANLRGVSLRLESAPTRAPAPR